MNWEELRKWIETIVKIKLEPIKTVKPRTRERQSGKYRWKEVYISCNVPQQFEWHEINLIPDYELELLKEDIEHIREFVYQLCQLFIEDMVRRGGSLDDAVNYVISLVVIANERAHEKRKQRQKVM